MKYLFNGRLAGITRSRGTFNANFKILDQNYVKNHALL